jgi:ADP-L-glycero-D-manno-heptose 6-epimerase
MRDFLYVKDAVDMTLFFLENKKANGIFNIGTGRPRTWLDVANALFAAMNQKPNIEFVDMPPSVKNQYQYFTQADITKIRAAGYKKDITPLEDSVKDYVQNYLKSDSFLAAPGI